MEIKEIYPKIFHLNLPIPLDVNDINIYLITGEVPTLIDTGLNTPLYYDAIKALMKKAGVKHIARILLTHWHIDHSGITAVLAEEGTEICTNALNYEEWLTFARKDSYSITYEWMVKDWGVPKEKLKRMYNNHCLYLTLYSLPSQVSLIQPGDFIQAGDYNLQIIPTPGHTRGHVSYWLEKEKLIFTGDTLLPNIISYPETWLEGNTRVSGLPYYISSIKKLESLGGQQYFPGHGTPGNDPTARCRIVLNQIKNQVARHVPAKDIYTGTTSLCEKFGSDFLLYFLHHVFGWEAIQKQKKVCFD